MNFFEISKSTFFTEHLRTTASEQYFGSVTSGRKLTEKAIIFVVEMVR